MTVQDVVHRSQQAFQSWRKSSPDDRARILEAIAATLEAHDAELLEIAAEETHLGSPRLPGELARTCFQLRMFAHALRSGTVLDTEIDDPVPGPPPEGHPRLVRVLRPLGVVAVFGASNFPFAFGIVGGDTASALAAGCTVVAKEHPAHPRLSARLVELARDAIAAEHADSDILTSIQGVQEGAELVAAEAVQAVGFTGSVAGGRFLYDIAVNRPQPIPFYGELGSVNPVVVTRAADAARASDIAAGFVDSLTLGAGQFCTKPAILIVPDGSDIPAQAATLLAERAAVPLLTSQIAESFDAYVVNAANQGTLLAGGTPQSRTGTEVQPTLIEASVDQLLTPGSVLAEECFGPSAVVVRYRTDREAEQLCATGGGVLVSCIHGEPEDEQVATLHDILEQRSGRLVWNGWPTGVAVTPAQMHGGPYPASTASRDTSVGLHAIERFVRPVVLQDFPIADS